MSLNAFENAIVGIADDGGHTFELSGAVIQPGGAGAVFLDAKIGTRTERSFERLGEGGIGMGDGQRAG